MDAPDRLGYDDVTWSPSTDDDSREVIAMLLQHRVVLAVRHAAGRASVREMAARVGVGKSTMARWLSGQELLNVSGLAALAAAFGPDVLADIVPAGPVDTVELLPEPYRPLATMRGGRLELAVPDEPAWSHFAKALADTVTAATSEGRDRLLSASALAWVLARAADELPPTRGLVDLDNIDSATITFGLDEPIVVSVVRVTEDTTGVVRKAILSALSNVAAATRPERRVIALTLGPRGGPLLDQLAQPGPTDVRVITSLAIARAGLGDPVDPDLLLREHSRSAANDGLVVLLESLKTPSIA